ncbi:hypothetical protein SmJEL517_g02137 [Synchytrium microbalum]|uniref:BRCT domain-containing protein n=1 Tax=Synchytrium microbalum TaxID=1806994 RepID=A0A507CC56_9FUNG|nr:uncharacterized protein SmJEL517_g02137 [Synchytrium microbalum]TPX35524.1 hypothetical protein SmJEL517_g02137 [Synchytrium microbalum]
MATRYRCLEGMLFCSTGLPANQLRDDMIDRIVKMGGQYNAAFTSDTSHLIALSTVSPKYKYAAKLEKPVVKPEWIEVCWNQCRSSPSFDALSIMDEYRLPPFGGLVICVTGFTGVAQRSDIKKLIEDNGGVFSADLLKTCTHLVASAPTGKKYDFAVRWKLMIVSLVWLEESVQKKARLEELEYPVVDDPQEQPGDASSAAETTSLLSAARPGPLFDRCNIYFGEGLATNQLAHCRKTVRDYGGATAKLVDGLVTHIVVGITALNDGTLDLIKSRPIPIVSDKWLQSCVDAKALVDIEPFVVKPVDVANPKPIPHEPIPKRIEPVAVTKVKVQIRSDRRRSSSLNIDGIYPSVEPIVGFDISNPLGVVSIPNKENVAVSKPIEIKPIEAGKKVIDVHFSDDVNMVDAGDNPAPSTIIAPPPIVNNVAGAATLPTDLFEKPADEVMSTCVPGTMIADTIMSTAVLESLLKGYAFACEGFSNAEEVQRAIEAEIVRKGGVLVKSRAWPPTSNSRTRFVVVPLSIHGLNLPPPVDCYFVTEMWLDQWCSDQRLPLLSACKIFQPTLAPFPIPGFSNACISVTGFNDHERYLLDVVTTKIGATFTLKFSKKNTHLLYKPDGDGNSAKLEKARGWKIPILNPDWLYDAVPLGAMPDIQPYLLKPLEPPEFKPRFDTSDAMTALLSPTGAKDSLVSAGSPLESAFASGILKAKENTSKMSIEPISAVKEEPFIQPPEVPVPIPSSSQLSQVLADGVVVCVSQKLLHRRSELYRICNQLGATTIPSYSDQCTHYVHQGNRQNETTKDFKSAKLKNKFIVSPFWLEKCFETGIRQSESDFPHTYNPVKALTPAAKDFKTIEIDMGDDPSSVGNDAPEPIIPYNISINRDPSIVIGKPPVFRPQIADEPSPNNSPTNTKSGVSPVLPEESQSSQVSSAAAAKVDELFNVKIDKRRRPRPLISAGRKPSLLESPMDIDIMPSQMPVAHSIDAGFVAYEDTEGIKEKRKLIEQFQTRKRGRMSSEEPGSDAGSLMSEGVVETVGLSSNLGGLFRQHGRHSRLSEPPIDGNNRPADAVSSVKSAGIASISATELGDASSHTAKTMSITSAVAGTTAKTTTTTTVSNNQPKILMSGIQNPNREKYTKMITRLGGIALKSEAWVQECTHLVVVNTNKTEKYIAACASGSWILKPSYLEACEAEGRLVEPDPHEYLPPVGSNSSGVGAGFRWRKHLGNYLNLAAPRNGAFQTWNVLLVATPEKADPLARIIRAGGGIATIGKAPFNTMEQQNYTHCIIDERPGVKYPDPKVLATKAQRSASPTKSNAQHRRGSNPSNSTSQSNLLSRNELRNQNESSNEGQQGTTILFSACKGELFTLTNGFKSLQKRLRTSFKVVTLKDGITESKLGGSSLVVFGAPRDKFSSAEFGALKSYVDGGGSVLYLATEGGESQLVFPRLTFHNSDSVIRTMYYKYYHPKEVLITNGVLNRELNRAAGKRVGSAGGGAGRHNDAVFHDKENPSSLSFVFPFGATLNVQTPSVPILSSSAVSYPVNRPIGSAYAGNDGRGKLVVVGSAYTFSDEYIDKDENGKLFDVLIRFLTTDRITLNSIDASEPEISDYHFTPDVGKLADSLRESDDIPKDFTSLFDHQLFKFDLDLLPKALKVYTDLGLKHEPLTLIPPEFETPLPPLHLALHSPDLRALPPPSLELFDLDEVFAAPRARLARLANKCDDDDLEYFIREAGSIVGASQRLDKKRESKTSSISDGVGITRVSAKEVLAEVTRCLINWKGAGGG